MTPKEIAKVKASEKKAEELIKYVFGELSKERGGDISIFNTLLFMNQLLINNLRLNSCEHTWPEFRKLIDNCMNEIELQIPLNDCSGSETKH